MKRLNLVVILSLAAITVVKAQVPFETDSSKICRRQCINEGHKFCPNLDFSKGKCCDKDAQCDQIGLCSDDITPEAEDKGLEYWACPHEAGCGRKIRVAKEVTQTIKVGKNFEDNEICGYKFIFSIDDSFGQIMEISIPKSKNVGMSFAVGSSFSNAVGNRITSKSDTSLKFPYPYSLYLNVFCAANLEGSFEINYKSYYDASAIGGFNSLNYEI